MKHTSLERYIFRVNETGSEFSTKLLLRGVSWFDVCLFILKNIRICCKLEIQVSMANEQG